MGKKLKIEPEFFLNYDYSPKNLFLNLESLPDKNKFAKKIFKIGPQIKKPHLAPNYVIGGKRGVAKINS